MKSLWVFGPTKQFEDVTLGSGKFFDKQLKINRPIMINQSAEYPKLLYK